MLVAKVAVENRGSIPTTSGRYWNVDRVRGSKVGRVLLKVCGWHPSRGDFGYQILERSTSVLILLTVFNYSHLWLQECWPKRRCPCHVSATCCQADHPKPKIQSWVQGPSLTHPMQCLGDIKIIDFMADTDSSPAREEMNISETAATCPSSRLMLTTTPWRRAFANSRSTRLRWWNTVCINECISLSIFSSTERGGRHYLQTHAEFVNTKGQV